MRHNLPRWDGSPFPEKRLYVHDEQGFGDTIERIRMSEALEEPLIRAIPLAAPGLARFSITGLLAESRQSAESLRLELNDRNGDMASLNTRLDEQQHQAGHLHGQLEERPHAAAPGQNGSYSPCA